MQRIGIYPGNFQPAVRSHWEIYRRLKSLVGDSDVFIVTTDREPTPEAPLNFGDKEQIWVRHGVPASHVIKANSLPTDDTEKAEAWRPEEVYHKFTGAHTVAIVALNDKEARLLSRRKTQQKIADRGMSAGVGRMSLRGIRELKEIQKELISERHYMDTDEKDQDPDTEFSRQNVSHESHTREVWMSVDGKPQYYQPYRGNENNLRPLEEHAYVVVMDDTKIQGKPISTTNIRNVLGSKKYNDVQKRKFFQWVFGWFDIGLYKLMVHKFHLAHQVVYPGDEPSMPVSNRMGTNVQQTKLSTSTPNPEPQNRVYNPQRRLEEIVREILWEIAESGNPKEPRLYRQDTVDGTVMFGEFDPEKNVCPPGFNVFTIERIYTPSNSTSTGHIVCRNAHELNTLLKSWNSTSTWKYKSLPNENLSEYMNAMLTPNTQIQDSGTDSSNMTTTGQDQKNASVNSPYQRQQLLDKKRELETQAKQNKEQRNTASTFVQNYDTNLKKNDRASLDAVNQQLSKY